MLTSNRTRELHDALKRRCLYHWIGYPTAERELEIVLVREPGRARRRWPARWSPRCNRLRELDLAKPPGVAETIDWVRTLDFLGGTDARPGERGQRHPRRGGQGPRRPRAGPRQPGGDHLRCADQRRPFAGVLVGFARELRAAGLAVGSGDVADLLRGDGRAGPDRPGRPVLGGRTTLVNRRESIAVYDEVFRRYFLGDASPAARAADAQALAARRGRGRARDPADRPGGGRDEEEEAVLGWMASDVGGAQAQVVRGLHARGAGRAAADHGQDPADPAAAAHQANRAGPAGRVPTCAGRCARPCACTASRPSCAGAGAGYGCGR